MKAKPKPLALKCIAIDLSLKSVVIAGCRRLTAGSVNASNCCTNSVRTTHLTAAAALTEIGLNLLTLYVKVEFKSFVPEDKIAEKCRHQKRK